jgi:hypothetical protein
MTRSRRLFRGRDKRGIGRGRRSYAPPSTTEHSDLQEFYSAWTTSGRYEDPDQLLRRITPIPEPLSDLRSIAFGRDLEEFRERLARELVAEKVSEAKALEMLLAATEIAANAIEHGGGEEEVRVGRAEGRFVCEIIDHGKGFDDPAVGYLAPRERESVRACGSPGS